MQFTFTDSATAPILFFTTVAVGAVQVFYVSNKFDKVDTMFDKVDTMFDKVDSKFDKVESKFSKVESNGATSNLIGLFGLFILYIALKP